MAKKISNMKQLEAALMPTMTKMADKMADRVYETLNYFLQEYYNSYEPVYYRRQYDFLRSVVKVGPKRVGNKIVASIYIDTNSMDDYYNATGRQVAEWANQGTHGGTVTGSNTPHVWDDAVENTVSNEELLELALDYLKSKGFSVSKK